MATLRTRYEVLTRLSHDGDNYAPKRGAGRMAVLALNSDDKDPGERVERALGALPDGAPIVIMIHGFRYCPHTQGASPHEAILADKPRVDCWKAISWPRHLGLHRDEGLALAFGWPARGSFWKAYGMAEQAGQALGALLRDIARRAPGHPVHILAHSLGARVGLIGAEAAPVGTVERMIFISPALFQHEAATLCASPNLARSEVFSILGRENTMFDTLLRMALPLQGVTLGRGGPMRANWLDIRLDCPDVLGALAGLGHRIAPPRARICHWSGYLRPGVFGLYRALLLTPEERPLPLLRGAVGRKPDRPRGPLPLAGRPIWVGRSS